MSLNPDFVIVINHNNNILFTNSEVCICCMDLSGNIKLCIKCNYEYCLLCSEKLNNKCCICFRHEKKKHYNHNYDYNEYNDYDYNDYNEQPIIYPFPYNFITLLIGWIISMILYTITIIGSGFFLIIFSKMFLYFIFLSYEHVKFYIL